MIKCNICNKEYAGIQPLSKHITAYHNISKIQYYDTYIKHFNEGICLACGKPTHFYGMARGYNKYCSKSCQVKAQGNGAKIDHNKMWEIRRNTIKQYEQEHNCIHLANAVDKYGRILYKCIEDLKIPVIKLSRMYQYISNDYITSIEYYIDHYIKSGCISKAEKRIINYLKYNGTIVENSKKVISPLELDVYLPAIKLAIEYNGTWHHSIEAGCSKSYHLNKSLECRKKNIRLVHIYEFEDFNTQIDLVNSLIAGIDKYNKNDFNKNNLLTDIPSVELIYVSKRGYHIYGAGKLY